MIMIYGMLRIISWRVSVAYQTILESLLFLKEMSLGEERLLKLFCVILSPLMGHLDLVHGRRKSLFPTDPSPTVLIKCR